MKPKNARRRKMDQLRMDNIYLNEARARQEQTIKTLRRMVDEKSTSVSYLRLAVNTLLKTTSLPWHMEARTSPITYSHCVTTGVSVFEWQQVREQMGTEEWALLLAFSIIDKLDGLTQKE